MISKPEETLAIHLRAARIPFEREVVLDELRPRRWRWDFVIGRLLVEVQGGVHSGGRHTRGYGYTSDCEKLNAAVLAGFRVLWYTPEHISKGVALEQIRKAVGAYG